MMKSRILAVVLGLMVVIAGVAIAQAPKTNVSGARHPNLAAAQRLSHEAWEKVVAAQEANEWDLGGHAQKARDLLDEANKQLKLAAETANRNGH